MRIRGHSGNWNDNCVFVTNAMSRQRKDKENNENYINVYSIRVKISQNKERIKK